MQNIDPLVLLQPAISLAIVVVTLVYWWRRHGFRGVLLALGAAAYFAAIAAKAVLSAVAAGPIVDAYGSSSVEYATLVGLETVVFEVGLAYALAVYGARKRGLKTTDGVAFGISLAFWENGVLLGALSLFGLGVLYLILSTGSSLAQTVYAQLVSASPGLFDSPAALAPSVALAALERVSSLLAHVAWGTLCVLAAVTGRRKYLLVALPMGLLDFLVPFASYNIVVFEVGVFLLSLGFFAVAWLSLKAEQSGVAPAALASPQGPVQ